MISFINGTLIQKTPTYVVVESGGFGLQIYIPLSSYNRIGEVGDSVHILSYLHVREDNLQLFGFATEEERELFKLLISVSGIGPRSAQGILSGCAAQDFKRAIINQDMQTLTSAPGVGKKTAERLVLELKDKVGESVKEAGYTAPAVSTHAQEAISALVTLGYKQSKAEEMVQFELKKDDSLSVEDILRFALRRS